MFKVLIADDESHIRILLEQTLEDLVDSGEIELVMAENGAQALYMAYEKSPQLVILDVMMPHCNGYEVCKQLKQEFKNSIYVIFLTAKGQELDKKNAIEAGMDEYITKPFEPDFIVSKVKHIKEKFNK
ncbi:MAG: response regulator [Candidatus Wallbacteria bacterium]